MSKTFRLVAIDYGSFALKGQCLLADATKTVDFLSYIAPISAADWNRIVRGGNIPVGYVQHNGSYYAVGDAARRHALPNAVRGAMRYRAGLYDVAIAYATARLLQMSANNIAAMLMYPPQDSNFATDIESLIRDQDHHIVCADGEFRLKFPLVYSVDEPLCGYSHITLNADGSEAQRNPLGKGTTLMVDVGGNTTDTSAIDPDGMVDYLSLRSSRTGTINVLREFDARLRADYKPEFRDVVGDIDPARLDQALRLGYYQYGTRQLDCNQAALECIRPFVDDIIQVITAAGGVAAYDVIAFTGGGSPVVLPHIRTALPDARIVVADNNIAQLRYANCRGGAKMLRLLRNNGVF